ncbi:MAG: hypothetical protein JXR58_11120 [Bacteroidales bacterium]|nr:hypothetical protein [Bacteroidales bacterium]
MSMQKSIIVAFAIALVLFGCCGKTRESGNPVPDSAKTMYDNGDSVLYKNFDNTIDTMVIWVFDDTYHEESLSMLGCVESITTSGEYSVWFWLGDSLFAQYNSDENNKRKVRYKEKSFDLHNIYAVDSFINEKYYIDVYKLIIDSDTVFFNQKYGIIKISNIENNMVLL